MDIGVGAPGILPSKPSRISYSIPRPPDPLKTRFTAGLELDSSFIRGMTGCDSSLTYPQFGNSCAKARRKDTVGVMAFGPPVV